MKSGFIRIRRTRPRSFEAFGGTWKRVLAPVTLIFQGFVNWSPFKVPVGSVLWNKVWIFTNLKGKAVGDSLSMMTFLVLFCGRLWQGSSWAWTCRSWGSWWATVCYMSSCISTFGAAFFDFECIRVAKSDFKHFGGNFQLFFFFGRLLSQKFPI